MSIINDFRKAQMTDDESNELDHEAALQQALTEIIQQYGYGAMDFPQLEEIAVKFNIDPDTLVIEYFGKSEPVMDQAVVECNSMIKEGFPVDKAAELCANKYRVPQSLVKDFLVKYEEEGWTPESDS